MDATASVLIDQLMAQFETYRITHPNLTQCWVSYLGLKKKHYEAHSYVLIQCKNVLSKLSGGLMADLDKDDLLRIILYKCTV
jgi:hypothetical protein